jgi:hypothetical protein
MSYKPRTLFRLLEEINTSLFLPHIQRPFVWDTDQMVRLFDSLMRNYPIQTLLFWRTKDEIKARKFMEVLEWDADLHEYYDKVKSTEGVEKVFVLDGQQRLQTLYVLFSGVVRDEKEKKELEAFFDITGGVATDDDGLLYRLQFLADAPGLPYIRLRDLTGKFAQKNAEEIADTVNDALDEAFPLPDDERKSREKRVRRNTAQVVSLLREEKYFWVEELDGIANDYPYKRILDIFVRVNSGGTKLDAADLMFAAMKEGWDEIEEKIEEVVSLLNDGRLSFDKALVLKCIVTALGKGAELKPEKFTGKGGEELLGEIESNWVKIESTFQQLRDFILSDLRLFGDKVVRSYNSFIPLFDYVYHNPKPNPAGRVLMRGYYYKAQLFNWYGARTDGLINAMHGFVGKLRPDGFPMADIKLYFKTSRGADTEFTTDTLRKMPLRYIVLNMVYVERFGTSPFNVRFKGNEPHIDHIYPQSMLRSKLGLGTDEVNSIGNYRFVGATDNIRKRAELPANYFGQLKLKGVDIEKHLLLSAEAANPALLAFDVITYRKFRDRRLATVFAIGNRIVNPECVS